MVPSFYAKRSKRSWWGTMPCKKKDLTFVALWAREMLFPTLVVESLCEGIVVFAFVERIEVHEIFAWPSFELKRGLYISAFASSFAKCSS